MAVTGYFLDQDSNYHEILLGFEPLSGLHNGSYLSNVLYQLLAQHQIEARVLTATTDNASNNSTLIDSLEDPLKSLELSNQTPIIRMPCIAHVLRLSLKELLGRMDVNSWNDREEMEWTERDESVQEGNQVIIYPLTR
jgi:hypothetical protein